MPELVTQIRESGERPRWVRLQKDIPASSVASLRQLKVAKVALTPVVADGFAFAWQNPEDNEILVTRVAIHVTTAAAAAATLRVGVVADATTGAAGVIAAAPLDATGVTDNLTAITETHKVDVAGGTAAWVTGQVQAFDADDMAGFAYIEYTEV